MSSENPLATGTVSTWHLEQQAGQCIHHTDDSAPPNYPPPFWPSLLRILVPTHSPGIQSTHKPGIPSDVKLCPGAVLLIGSQGESWDLNLYRFRGVTEARDRRTASRRLTQKGHYRARKGRVGLIRQGRMLTCPAEGHTQFLKIQEFTQSSIFSASVF